jgi:hypothetical protein
MKRTLRLEPENTKTVTALFNVVGSQLMVINNTSCLDCRLHELCGRSWLAHVGLPLILTANVSIGIPVPIFGIEARN